MEQAFSRYAMVPKKRASVLRPVFLDAFPQSGAWTTKWELAEKLHASEVWVRELLREFQDAGLVERGPSIAHRKSWTYTYHLTRAGVNRNGGAGHLTGGDRPLLALGIATSERLLPDRYEGLGGLPGPIDQACRTCKAKVGTHCFDMHWRASGDRGSTRGRPRLGHPHRSRRTWRGHMNGRTGIGALTVSPLDRECTKCRAPKGSGCYSMSRWGRRLPGEPLRGRPHPERIIRWVS